MKSSPYIVIISVNLLAFTPSTSLSCDHVKSVSHHIKELTQLSPRYRKKNQTKNSEQEIVNKQKLLIQCFFQTSPQIISVDQFKDSIFLLNEYNTFPMLRSCYTTIVTALNTLNHVKGFFGLIRILIINLYQPNGFFGFLYELEKALQIHKEEKQEQLIEFQQIVNIPNSKRTREFDIVTSKRIIECKNINWKKTALRRQFIAQKRVVDQINKKNGTNITYEVCSKRSIPQSWQQWFQSKKIKFSSDEFN